MRFAFVLLLVPVVGILTACSRGPDGATSDGAPLVRGGEPKRGAEALEAYGCGGCHIIPGIPDASSPLGPSLAGLALRRELAGGLENTPDNLMRWIQNPQEIDPSTGMPDLEVTDEDARHMAAYLYTLR